LSVTLPPPPPPELGDPRLVDPEALIREARRRARRRRQRNFAGVLAAVLGVLWLHSLLRTGGAESGGVPAPGAPAQTATPPKVALPEELSFNANGGIVLVRRNGTRRGLAPGIVRRVRSGGWHLGLYASVDWSPDGSKLLARRWGSEPELVVINANGKVTTTIGRRALDGRWSPDGTRIAFVRGGNVWVKSVDAAGLCEMSLYLNSVLILSCQ